MAYRLSASDFVCPWLIMFLFREGFFVQAIYLTLSLKPILLVEPVLVAPCQVNLVSALLDLLASNAVRFVLVGHFCHPPLKFKLNAACR